MNPSSITYSKTKNKECFDPDTKNTLKKKNYSTNPRLPYYYKDLSYEKNKEK